MTLQRWKGILRHRFVKGTLLLNLLFWIYFSFFFALVGCWPGFDPYVHVFVQPYVSQGHGFVQPHVFGGCVVGLGQNLIDYDFGRLMYIVQFPSALIAHTLPPYLLNPPVTSFILIDQQKTFAGINIWGYQLIAVMFLSFVQWYWIARFLAWTSRKLKARGDSPSLDAD